MNRNAVPLLAAAALLLVTPDASAGKPSTGPATAPSKPQVCGRNLNCLSSAARTCGPAQADHETTMTIAGVTQKTVNHLEILGRDGERCILRMTQATASVKLDAKARAGAASRGMSNAQIDQMERQANKDAAANRGQPRTCKVPSARLAQAIARWNNGSFSSDDLPQECAGSVEIFPGAR